MEAILNRLRASSKQTQGIFTLYDDDINLLYSCVMLELPWLANQRRISCIPKGEYLVTPRVSDKHGEHWLIHEVPDRDYILIHSGNFVGSRNPKTGHSDLLGCIAPGVSFVDIDGDGTLDISASKFALNGLNKATNRLSFKLKII